MLPVSPVEDLEDLSLGDEDYQAILGSRDTRALKAVLKFCWANVGEKESRLCGEYETPLTDAHKERLIGARNAFYRVATLIMDPPIKESDDE